MFIGVYVEGGLISDVITGEDVNEVRERLIKICPIEEFDPCDSDIRIFTDDNKEYESLYSDEEIEENIKVMKLKEGYDIDEI